MSRLLDEMRPRKLLNLDHPSQHLTPEQFLVALAIIGMSATFWGFITGSRFVPMMVAGTQILSTWRTPTARETVFDRSVAMFVWGALCAAIWLLLKLAGGTLP